MSLLFAQADFTTTTETSSGGGFGAGFWVLFLVFHIVAVVGLWKSIEKTGQPGAWSLVWLICAPIGMFPILKASGRPTWWIVLFFIPIVNIIMLFVVFIDLAKSFGKSAGWGVGLTLLPFLFFLMLGFGSARYEGPAVTA